MSLVVDIEENLRKLEGQHQLKAQIYSNYQNFNLKPNQLHKSNNKILNFPWS